MVPKARWVTGEYLGKSLQHMRCGVGFHVAPAPRSLLPPSRVTVVGILGPRTCCTAVSSPADLPRVIVSSRGGCRGIPVGSPRGPGSLEARAVQAASTCSGLACVPGSARSSVALGKCVNPSGPQFPHVSGESCCLRMQRGCKVLSMGLAPSEGSIIISY